MKARTAFLFRTPLSLLPVLLMALLFCLGDDQVLAASASELVERRTLTSKTFDNGDGTLTLETRGAHVHYVDEETGELRDCDTTLTDMGERWTQSKASYACDIPKHADGSLVFRDLFENKHQTVVMRPLAAHVRGRIDDSDGWVKKRILYRHAYGKGLHLRVTAGNVGLFKEVIIENKPDPLRDLAFDFEISLPSEEHLYVQDRPTGGSFQKVALKELVLTNGQELLIGDGPTHENAFSRIQKIRVWDSSGEARAGRLEFYRRGSTICFRKIVPKEFLASATYPVYTDDTVTYYAGTGDGYTNKGNDFDWDITHDATESATAQYTVTESYFCRTGKDGSNHYIITRVFFPFYTEPLPDTANILDATLSLYVTTKQNADNDGEDFFVVVQTTQPSTSALTIDDYDLCGSVNSPTEGSNRVDCGNITTGQYNDWTLNTTGLGWISKTDWTKLGMREGHDVLDHPIVAAINQKNRINGYWADQSGTTTDPKLFITYSLPYTVSGTLYSDEGVTPITGAAKTVNLQVNGQGTYTAETNSADGTFSISDVYMVAGDVVTLFVDDETEKAVTVTRSAGSDISGLDLYQNRVIVRHEDAGPITNADLSQYDKDDDGDIHFTSNANSLIVDNDHELHVWTGDSFSPGGSVTTSSGGTSPGSDIHIHTNATFTAGGSISCGGSWTAESGSSFTHSSNTVTFAATATGKTITTNGQSFYNLTLNNAGGGWTFQDNVDVANDLTITNGQVTGPSSGTINIGNNWDVSGGTFTHNDSEVIFDATDSGNTITSGSNGTFYDLSFNGAGGSWTFQDNVDVANDLTITNGQVTGPSSGTINIGNNWDVSGGTFT
ncbi:MAG: hypothetical protein SWQ30_05300, partial [Thermodesulfobacteriota bacterium]|nr:hypothetical protein [Thermodesulfobacteriota bacterium]